MFKKKIQKLAGLWLAGEVVNHVGIYGSKAAEGLSAFQRRSCLTHCGLGDFNEILDERFSSQLQWLMAEIPAVKLPSEECH